MTWKRKEAQIPMGRCPSCSADLVPMMNAARTECFYRCSRTVCKYARKPVPPSSSTYAGPDA